MLAPPASAPHVPDRAERARSLFVWALAMVHRKPVHGLRLHVRALMFAVLGVTMGTLLDAMHVWNLTAEYTNIALIPYLDVAWYVPIEFAVAGMAVGLLRPELDEELRRKRSDLPVWKVVLGLALLALVWAGSGLLTRFGVPNWIITVALTLVAVGAWLGLDRTWAGVVAALITAALGVGAESAISQTGTYHYMHPDFLGVPSWLPSLYLTVCIAGGNAGRFLKYSWDIAFEHPAPQEEEPRQQAA